MLFVAEYELTWDMFEGAMAKRLDWDEVMPDSFRYIGEYIWQDGDPAFRGIAIFEADSVGDVNSFVLQYGPALTMKVHPASDVVSALEQINQTASPVKRKRRSRKR